MRKGQCDPTGCCGGVLSSRNMLDIFSKDRKFKSESTFLLRQIEYYQRFIDPQLKKKLNVKKICRYSPTCSQYTRMSIKRHGAIKGLALGAYRLLRCNPFSKGGPDPVK